MRSKFRHKNNPITRNIKVFRASFAGWWWATRNDAGVKQWSAICILASIIAIWLASGVELVLMLASLWMIYVIELLNTGLEVTLDRISTEHDLKIKAAKDIGSAAVFATVLIAVMVWGIILWP